jgi:hypothetical protein
MQHEYDAHNLGIASAKIPPSWSPERDKSYPLRTWIQDTRLWSVGTDVDANKQGPVVALRIGGSAKELIRELDVNVLANGGVFPDAQNNPVQLTGLECLIRAMQRRYGPLEQELEIFCISEMLHFSRHQGEDTDSVVNRFNLCRGRALNGAGFDMSWVGFSFLLLTILGIHKSHWPVLLSPTQGALPRTQQEFDDFTAYVRRQGHLTDRNVDTVKNLQFFSSDINTSNVFMANLQGNSWEQPAQSLFSPQGSWTDPEPVFALQEEDYADSADDGLSSCNSGTSFANLADMQGYTEQTAGEQLYLEYRHAKKRWRSFAGGRKRLHFRRFNKFGSSKGGSKGHRKGGFKGGGFKGQGKHKGKGKLFYVDSMTGTFHPVPEPIQTYALVPTEPANPFSTAWDDSQNIQDDEQVVYLAGKGQKGGGSFKRKNPRGKDGKQLLCSLCNSDSHLIRHCPQNKTGMNQTQFQQKGSGGNTFVSSASSSSGNPSSASWNMPVYFGQEQQLETPDSSNCCIVCEGETLTLESSLPVAPVVESERHYFMPAGSQLEKKPQLSASGSVSHNFMFFLTTRTSFMFPWFESMSLFHAQVRCKGFESLLIDVGAWGNLVGALWVKRVRTRAALFGHGCQFQKLQRVLSVEGVGQNANSTSDEVTMPICLPDGDVCSYTAPVLEDSELPALLGLKSLSEKRCIIDTFNRRLIFVGEGGYKLQLSPGSKTYPLHSAATGHLMLQCDAWDLAKVDPKLKQLAF